MITTNTNWDESAKRVLEFSREIAADIGGNIIGTEHLLLGLVRETSVDEHGIEALHFEAVLSTVRWIYTPTTVLTHGCQTPVYKKALESAAKRATAESRPISRRDLWYGLLADPQAFGNSVLETLGIEDQVRNILG